VAVWVQEGRSGRRGQEFEQQRAAQSDLRAKYYSGNDVTKNDAVRTYAMFGGERKSTQCCGRETLGKETTWKT